MHVLKCPLQHDRVRDHVFIPEPQIEVVFETECVGSGEACVLGVLRFNDSTEYGMLRNAVLDSSAE